MSLPAQRLAAGASAAVEDFPVAMEWAADGSQVVIGGGEGRIFGVTPEKGLATLLGEHAPGVLQLAWQPRGTRFVSSGQDGGVRLWDGAGGGPAQVVHRSTRWPAGLACRADGMQFAFASGKDVLIRDSAGGPLRTIAGHGTPLSQLLWRGRDEIIAAGNGVLCVDRVDTGEITEYELEGVPATLALSPDLKVAASGLTDGTINFRYLNSRKRSRMSGYEGKVEQTAWSANSRYLATASSGAAGIVVWDFAGKGPEGSEPLQLTLHEDRIEALAWQPAGPLLASTGRDWRVVLWRPGPGSRQALDIQLLDGPAGMMCWSPDGRLLAVAQTSGRIRFFSLSAA